MSVLQSKRRAIINEPHKATQSGAIVTMDKAEYAPMGVVANFAPVQDLHGQTSPYPAGGGKNLLQTTLTSGSSNQITYTVNSDGSITLSGTATGLVEKTVGTVELTADTSYKMNGCSYASNSCRIQLKYNGSSVMNVYNNQDTTYNCPTTGTYTVTFVVTSGTTPNTVLYPMIRLASITDNTFAPYSNICPISGWTGCNVYQSGADYATETESGTITTDGADSSDTGERTPYIKVKTGNIVQTNIKNNAAGYRYTRIACYDINKQFISLLYNAVTAANAEKTITETVPNGTAYIRISVSQGTINSCYILLAHTVDWTSSAGTAYGGSLDLASGVLTKTWENIGSYNGETLPNEWISDRDVYSVGTTPTIGAQVCYELATPITYTLTPTQIKSLRGKNNVWTDMNGNTSATIYVH